MKTEFQYRNTSGKMTLNFTDKHNFVDGKMNYVGGPMGALGHTGYMEYKWTPNAIRINTIISNPKRIGIGALMIYLAAQKAILAHKTRIEVAHPVPTEHTFYIRMGVHPKRADIADGLRIRQLPNRINPWGNPQGFVDRLEMRIYMWDGDVLQVSRLAEASIRNKWNLLPSF